MGLCLGMVGSPLLKTECVGTSARSLKFQKVCPRKRTTTTSVGTADSIHHSNFDPKGYEEVFFLDSHTIPTT
jgi:hypothetical protein